MGRGWEWVELYSCSSPYAFMAWPRRLQEVHASYLLKQLVHDGGNVVSPTHLPPLPTGKILLLICVRSWVDSRATMQTEGLSESKISELVGNRTRDLLAVAQCLNQLRYHVRNCCYYYCYLYDFNNSQKKHTYSQLVKLLINEFLIVYWTT